MICKATTKKKYPQKPNAEEELLKKDSHIIYQKGAFEFILPSINHFNRFLFNNLPTANLDELGKIKNDGKLGQVVHFYIPNLSHKTLVDLFNEFEIPEKLFPDLMGVYINMFFATCTATFSTVYQHKWDKGFLELSNAFDFLSLLASEKINISKLYLTYQDINVDENNQNKRKFDINKTIKFESTLGVGLLEDALKNYKTSHNYNLINSFKKVPTQKEKLFFGHKNELKNLQIYYANVILVYLSKTLFQSLVVMDTKQPEDLKKESLVLNKKYSQRRRYLFTGKLMFIAGLLQNEEYEVDDEKLIDTIRKKSK